MILAFLLASATGGASLCQTGGQLASPAETSQDKSNVPAATYDKHITESSGQVAKTPTRADAYYNYTMGHIFEQQYESTSKPEYATQAIEGYKKAYALDPKSPVIGERLAEMYWKAQRTHEAVTEAQALLKRDPTDALARTNAPANPAPDDFKFVTGGVRVIARVRVTGQTGVEMEALTAASVAGLTLIDMTKGIEKGVYLESVRLLEKSGGRSGTWKRPA